jgi:hypothetical protein
MRRLAILSMASFALAAAPAQGAVRADCGLAGGPISTAAAGKRVLIVGAAQAKGKTLLVSCLVKRDGSAAARPRILSVPSKTPIEPAALALARKGRGFLLISSQNGRLAAHVLGPGGGAGALGKPLPRYRGLDAANVDAACAHKSGRCLVTWAAGEGSDAVTAGLRFRSPAKPARRPFVVTGPHRDARGGAGVASAGKNLIAAWTRRSGARSRLQARVVPAKGPPRRVFTFYETAAGRSAGSPVVAAAASRLVGAAWEEAGNVRFTTFKPGRRGEQAVQVTRYGGGAAPGEPAVAYTGVGNIFDIAWPRAGNAFTRTVAFAQVRVLGSTHCLSCKRKWGSGKVAAMGIAGAGKQTSATWFARGRAFIARIP